jgi:peptide deformylase
VEKFREHLREGLAPPSAPHLYLPSAKATDADLKSRAVRKGTSMLEAYTRPGSGSPLSAVGMAYPQLAQASIRSLRILAAQSGMAAELRDEDRGQNVITLINPSYRPLRDRGEQLRREACFSGPGFAVEVLRWKEIMLIMPGQQPRRVTGTDAWILQHEIDHLDGTICAAVARRQRRRLYFVPPEWSSAFYKASTIPTEWPVFPWEQYEAMKRGAFDLASYARHL